MADRVADDIELTVGLKPTTACLRDNCGGWTVTCA